MKALKCTVCGAPLSRRGGFIKCEYCGTAYEEEEPQEETVTLYADNVAVMTVRIGEGVEQNGRHFL